MSVHPDHDYRDIQKLIALLIEIYLFWNIVQNTSSILPFPLGNTDNFSRMIQISSATDNNRKKVDRMDEKHPSFLFKF